MRELRAAVECAAALALPGAAAFATLDEEIAALERRRIVEALARTGHNHTHTAREPGPSRVGLLNKIDRMGLR